MSPMTLNIDAIMQHGSFHGGSAGKSAFLCRYRRPHQRPDPRPSFLEPISTTSLPTYLGTYYFLY
jgi:hypothetical protein